MKNQYYKAWRNNTGEYRYYNCVSAKGTICIDVFCNEINRAAYGGSDEVNITKREFQSKLKQLLKSYGL